jgi:hypothetical protein
MYKICVDSLVEFYIKKQALGRINRLLSFDTTWIAYKTTPPTVFLCRGNIFTESLPSNDRVIHRLTNRHTRPTTILLFCVFVAAGTCLPSRWLAIKEGYFTEPWPSSDRSDKHTDTHTDWKDL